MRLTLRFLALILLLVIATFPNSSSIATLAGEADNPCFEGCVRGYERCKGECGLNMACVQKCDAERDKCHAKCRSGGSLSPEEPVNY